MNGYDRSSVDGSNVGVGGDGFEAARVMFETTRVMLEAAVRGLRPPQVVGFTHPQTEDLLAEQYQEATRRLLQDLLDLKAAGELRLRKAT